MKIGITNLKGGVGKTTLSINLAVNFAHMEYKVCIIDTDTNQNSVHWRAAREEGLKRVTVMGITDHRALMKTVKDIQEDYEIIIMDGTPNLSEMNSSVILSSDLLIIPIRPGPNDFRAMTEFMEHLDKARNFKPDIPVYILVNEFDDRKTAHKTVKDALQDNFDIPILDTVIKSRTVYGEAALNGTGVYEETDDKAKAEMVALTNEVITVAEKLSLIQA